MSNYRFYVIGQDGKDRRGQIRAESWEQARDMLRTDGHTVLALHKVGVLESELELSFLKKRITAKELAIFCRQFLILTSAGIGLVRILELLEEQLTDPQMKKAMNNVRIRIEHGEAFHDALKKQNRIFSDLFCNMVRAGEHSGRMDVVFRYLAEYYDKTAALQNAVTKAMIYPAVLLAVSIVIMIVLFVYVIPVFAEFFEQMDMEVSGMTRLMIAFSGLVVNKGWMLVLWAVGGALGVILLLCTKEGRRVWDRLLLRLPFIGSLQKKINCARFVRNLSMLIGSGMPFSDALWETTETMNHTVYRQCALEACEQVRKGRRMSEVLKESGVFLPVVCQMVSIGEETGQMEVMLEHAAQYYETEASAAAEQAAAALEPLLILVMALVVMAIISAVFMPMMSVYNMMDVM